MGAGRDRRQGFERDSCARPTPATPIFAWAAWAARALGRDGGRFAGPVQGPRLRSAVISLRPRWAGGVP
eukprot:6299364-Lingulodinium_polyedra.AAC.1